jgi:glycerate kinase
VITGEGSIDEQTLAGKLPAAVARRSGTRPIIAVAGRSLLPRERWAEMSSAATPVLRRCPAAGLNYSPE